MVPSVHYYFVRLWCFVRDKKIADELSAFLNQEFDKKSLQVESIAHDNPLKFEVLLENTGKILHATNGLIAPLTEMENLMIVSKIGTWIEQSTKQ